MQFFAKFRSSVLKVLIAPNMFELDFVTSSFVSFPFRTESKHSKRGCFDCIYGMSLVTPFRRCEML